MAEPPAARISHEQPALTFLRGSLDDCTGFELFSGQGGGNRFGPVGWGLTALQEFQYGDLRVETPTTTIVVEVESGGGVGNLVKYWPLLAAKTLPKRFVIIHAFQITSTGDYIAHRKLWDFLVERMEHDLAREGIERPESWDAFMCTYAKGDDALEAAELLRRAVLAATSTAPAAS